MNQEETEVFFMMSPAFTEWQQESDKSEEFADWVERIYGFTFEAVTLNDFSYTVVDPGKFMWFKLRHG